jgi:hypothetical protein
LYEDTNVALCSSYTLLVAQISEVNICLHTSSLKQLNELWRYLIIWIWSSHDSDNEVRYVLGCDKEQSGRSWQRFWRIIMSPHSGLKNKLSMQNTSQHTISKLLSDYMVSHPIKINHPLTSLSAI